MDDFLVCLVFLGDCTPGVSATVGGARPSGIALKAFRLRELGRLRLAFGAGMQGGVGECRGVVDGTDENRWTFMFMERKKRESGCKGRKEKERRKLFVSLLSFLYVDCHVARMRTSDTFCACTEIAVHMRTRLDRNGTRPAGNIPKNAPQNTHTHTPIKINKFI